MADLNQIELPNNSTYNLVDTEGRKEENLVWGGPSKSADVSPIGMALSNEHSANRMAFFPGEGVKLEYSSNGGSTYTEYPSSPYNADFKKQLCTDAVNIPVGRTDASTSYTTSSRTRITFTVQDGTHSYMYSAIRKMLIQVSLSGKMNVKLEGRTGTNYKNNADTWSDFGTYAVAGCSGWNDIPLVQTIGGSSTQTSQIWQLRLTFIVTTVNSSYPATASVLSIRMYGASAWSTPSTIAKTGHLYTFDNNQNATFPAQVSATKFNGTATNADKVNNLTVQTAVPANAVFTDTNNAVTQTATSTENNSYCILFSASADSSTKTESARKSGNLLYNPSTKALSNYQISLYGNTGEIIATKLNGATIGSDPKFTDTTYESKAAASGGTAVSLCTTGEKYTWNNKSNPLLVSSVAVSINYGGQRYKLTTVNIAKSGYTALGTVGYQMSSIDNCVFRCDINGNNLNLGIFTRNGVATSEITTGYVFVLYVKQ